MLGVEVVVGVEVGVLEVGLTVGFGDGKVVGVGDGVEVVVGVGDGEVVVGVVFTFTFTPELSTVIFNPEELLSTVIFNPEELEEVGVGVGMLVGKVMFKPELLTMMFVRGVLTVIPDAYAGAEDRTATAHIVALAVRRSFLFILKV